MAVITFREALRVGLDEELARDERVFVMGEDVADPMGGSYKVTLGLSTKYGPARCRNTPISELGIVGLAVGAAITGMRPVAEIMYIDFMGLAMDQLMNQAALIRYMSGGQVSVPLVVRTHGGGGRSSAAQHGKNLEALFAHLPGLKMVFPGTPADAKGLLKAAVRDSSPVVFFEHNGLYNSRGEVPEGEFLVPIGKADVKRAGRDVTLVTYGRMLGLCLAAADSLAAAGVEAEVLDLRTISPLDREAVLASVARTHRAVVVHEANRAFGVGAEVAALLADEGFDLLDAPVRRVAAKDTPLPFAPVLERAVLPQTAEIVAAAREVCGDA
jgi:pyruvate/2-oxoglutarate/acetoin dehydrogenase E1 component